MENPDTAVMALNESKATRSSKKDRASGSPTMLSFHQKKGKFAGVVPRSDPERLQQFRRDVVEEFNRSTKARQKSVHQMAAMFKGGSKPENIEVFHKRHAQEEAAYRAKVHHGKKTLKNYSQGTDAMYNFVLKANLATTEGKERFLRRWAAGRMVNGESTTPIEGLKFLKSLGIDVPRLESPRSPPQDIAEETSLSPERVPKMLTPARGRARFKRTPGRYGTHGAVGSVNKEESADLEVVEWKKALSRAVGAMVKIDADACATRLDFRARKRRSASESGLFFKSKGPQTCRGPRTTPFFGADEDISSSHNKDDSDVMLGQHRASWSPLGSRSPRRTTVEQEGECLEESPDRRLSTASKLPCPETPTSGKAVRLSLSRLSDSPGRFSLSPVRSSLSRSPPRDVGDHDLSPVQNLLLPSRLFDLEEKDEGKTSTAAQECVMEDFNHSMSAAGPKSVRKMAAMFERGNGRIRRSGSIPGRAIRNVAPETYHGPPPKPFFGAFEPDLHVSRSDDSEVDLVQRSSWSPVGSRSGGSIGAMKVGRLSLSPERTCHNFPPVGEGSLLDCPVDVSETGDDFTEPIDDCAGVLQDQNVSLDGNEYGDSHSDGHGEDVPMTLQMEEQSSVVGEVCGDSQSDGHGEDVPRTVQMEERSSVVGGDSQSDGHGEDVPRTVQMEERSSVVGGDSQSDGHGEDVPRTLQIEEQSSAVGEVCGDSQSDGHGENVPMTLQPDDPYMDFDAILDGSAEERSNTSPFCNLTNCCGNFEGARDEVRGGVCTIS